MTETPNTVEEYLERLRRELAGCDPALVQDVLYDAEEYLRSEFDRLPEEQRAEGLPGIIERYGAPGEIAEAYRESEARIPRPPAPSPREDRSALRDFLGVLVDPRAYSAFFFMLLSLATGIFYFTWVVTGLSLSAGLAILIIGIPFLLLFLATVRVLSLVEGWIVEGLLGVRMPRRLPFETRTEASLGKRILALVTDPRTWSTMFYLALGLPLGILYFTLAVTLISVSLGLIFFPFAQMVWPHEPLFWIGGVGYYLPLWMHPLVSLLGFVLLVVTMHLARGIGKFHSGFAKAMLVKA